MDHSTRRAATTSSYRTPDWLERSFVLPTQVRRDHDDLPAAVPLPGSASTHTWTATADLVRTPGDPVDFARLVRRNSASLLARRTALLGLALSVVLGALVPVTPSAATIALLGLAVAAGLAGASITAVLRRAPVPHLRG